MQRHEAADRPRVTEALDGLLGDLSAAMLYEQIRAVPQLATLTPAHLRLLSWVDDHPSATWYALRREFALAPGRTRQTVKDLARLGLMEYGTEWPWQRTIRVRLTDRGCALLRRLDERRDALCARLLDGLTAEQKAALARGLSALASAEA
jgi:DNA-binding MarR family transcriptional regulator